MAARSPDGHWLVYQRMTVIFSASISRSDLPAFHSIFKVNLETGEEIKIVDHGLYPYWRWPAH